ncbi:hypothetical protein PoB_004345400 [Plakobranchus ocellatus]|uniref:Uncharacterized protein n=1 Tax=Plakobranchus ocellatus TaxID=259542 RepID=A0AAV4BF12_9GAST|nr:hypothetical protein PoB_004345400 [Plakobranchus ocellatus]
MKRMRRNDDIDNDDDDTVNDGDNDDDDDGVVVTYKLVVHASPAHDLGDFKEVIHGMETSAGNVKTSASVLPRKGPVSNQNKQTIRHFLVTEG